MGTALQIFFNSLSGAALYAMLALGLTIFLGIFGILNFAQGDFATVGGYAIYSAIAATGAGLYAASIAGVLAGAVLGLLFYFTIVKPLQHAPGVNQLLATFGVALFLQGLLQWHYTANQRSVRTSRESLEVGGAFLPVTTLVNTLIAIALIVMLFVLLYRTNLGRSIRAVSENPIGASLLGIDDRRAAIIACLIGGVLSAGAAVVLLSSYFLTPTVGFTSIFVAFTVVVAAGLGSLSGVVIASVLVSLAQALTDYYVSSSASQLVAFAIIVVILLVRPTGLAARGATA
jgi:branched-chain amino acid transport system permease protein